MSEQGAGWLLGAAVWMIGCSLCCIHDACAKCLCKAPHEARVGSESAGVK